MVMVVCLLIFVCPIPSRHIHRAIYESVYATVWAVQVVKPHSPYSDGIFYLFLIGSCWLRLNYSQHIQVGLANGRLRAEDPWEHICCAQSLDKRLLRRSSLFFTRGCSWRPTLSAPTPWQASVQVRLLYSGLWFRAGHTQGEIRQSWGWENTGS